MNLDGINLENIGEILGNMSPEDMEKLSGLASELFGEGERKNEKSSGSTQGSFFGFDGIDPASIGRIMDIMKRLNSRPSDPGCELISALKPLLSERRRKRADEAIAMLKMISLLPIIEEVM